MKDRTRTATPRLCAQCGSRLSRYNGEELCAACSRSGGGTLASDALLEETGPWLSHDDATISGDDAGAVLRLWRNEHRQNQAEVAAALGTTQQHLSQIEKGKRPLSLNQRWRAVEELGITPEELGLSSSSSGHAVADDEATPEVATSRLRWRNQRRWLNRHRSELARLAVQLYPEEERIARTTLITHPQWRLEKPVDLRSFELELDERPQPVGVDGAEVESQPVRPLRFGEIRFDCYTSAIKYLDPPRLFESRPSYRLLSAELPHRRLRFGLAAYFDKLDVSEALGHELAAACMDADGGLKIGRAHV